jgi:hypothetical protein
MEPKFQTSFIPKKPVSSTSLGGVSSETAVNIVTLGATVFLIFTIIASGGLFAYKYYLNSQRTLAEETLREAIKTFELDKTQDLIDMNARLVATNDLLEKHVVVSKLFLLLHEETLKNIKFDDFTYKNSGVSPTLTMKVEAKNYNALAYQKEVLSKNEFIINPEFSDFIPTENGNILASFVTAINPSLVSYKEAIKSLSSNQ